MKAVSELGQVVDCVDRLTEYILFYTSLISKCMEACRKADQVEAAAAVVTSAVARLEGLLPDAVKCPPFQEFVPVIHQSAGHSILSSQHVIWRNLCKGSLM